MTNEKRFKLDVGFTEALRRFARTDKRELDRTLAEEFTERDRKVKKSIESAREEIKRGARSGKPPFRP